MTSRIPSATIRQLQNNYGPLTPSDSYANKFVLLYVIVFDS